MVATKADERRIRLLVVDDHEIFTQSIIRLLESNPRFQVVGLAASVDEAISAAVAHEPDVILMDFGLPGGDGPYATERIKALTPGVKVIMLTLRTDEDAFVRAIAAGCAGFVRKGDTVENLFAAIIAAYENEEVSPPGLLTPLLRRLPATQRGLGGDLTAREVEVLELMASGASGKAIAGELGLSLNTVRNHSQKVLAKLQAHSRLEAVATAVRERLIGYPH